ncbi:pyridoxamine 5'-phosphate oxidase family protein [Rhodococcus sp. IEGM 1381]|uniref:pyridoxamine 5'-phosphate oxidase family protein n=1 Tax=Rhodococcus sp. IEGM 1381 TaxID=3047085 RepID=UPI0024B79039|nr:pyridoxamine 5'-phosphate oxidase family protein [Rhodococcus sp. IEGM 1381]MDI9893211.1 pyridoxamine 5'-phosphate oxidase family protein [Rhodococcus sp. IEGM 1381]
MPQSNHYHHLMFGPAAIARQKVDGSYTAYGSQTERPDDGPTPLDTREKAMIRAVDQFQIATVAETGWPYIQYRSGPKGFLQVLDDRTLGFADFAGNHQYVTAANLDHDDRVAVFLVNYPLRQRLKLYGRARTVGAADDPQLLERLKNLGDRTIGATCERSVVIDVEAFDWNCTRSIIPRYDAAYLADLSEVYQRKAAEREKELLQRISELEEQLTQSSAHRNDPETPS